VQPGSDDGRRFLVLDTSDASEGFIRIQRGVQSREGLGSAKKTAQAGDVVISRLRPYLRQVGFVDQALVSIDDKPHVLALSTEFYVLRTVNAQSIAFLVPFLLGAEAQAILAVSQEGGHHPRINSSAIEELVVPEGLLADRERVSAEVEMAVGLARQSEQMMRKLSGRSFSVREGAGVEAEPVQGSPADGASSSPRVHPGASDSRSAADAQAEARTEQLPLLSPEPED
jgi:hypothetical protein